MSPMHVTLKEGPTRVEFFSLLKETSFSIYFRPCFGHHPWSCAFKYTRPDKEGEESISHFLIIVCSVFACVFLKSATSFE